MAPSEILCHPVDALALRLDLVGAEPHAGIKQMDHCLALRSCPLCASDSGRIASLDGISRGAERASSSPKNCLRNCPRTATDEWGQSRTLRHNRARKVANFWTFPHKVVRERMASVGLQNRCSTP